MEIHKPRPWHNLREFAKEYVIIVLGVVTALAGEQLVEKLHDRARAAEARASIREEIARNLGYMEIREASEACMSKRLDEVDGLIADYARGVSPPQTLWIGQPFNTIMLDGEYKAATQSGAVSLFDNAEQAAYSSLYAVFATYWQQSLDEMRAWGDLRTTEKRPPWSPVLDWQLRSAMQQARNARYAIGLSRQVALRDASRTGIAPGHIDNSRTPPVCVPINTPRAEALKLSASHVYNPPIP